MNEKEIRARIEEGWLMANVIIEVLGKPREHVETTLTAFIDQIREDKDFVIIKKAVEEAVEKEGAFSAFADLELLGKDISVLIDFCFEYMPSSIEIVNPEKVVFDLGTLNDLLNDLLARLHRVDMMLKNALSENMHLKDNTSALLQNTVRLSVKEKAKTLKEIAEEVGMDEKYLGSFIDKMVVAGRLDVKDQKFFLAENGSNQKGSQKED